MTNTDLLRKLMNEWNRLVAEGKAQGMTEDQAVARAARTFNRDFKVN